MALSIFTNAASMASTTALNKSNNLLGTSMQRLGTGKRINSAADDAAGLQIASRLQGQSNGMSVARRNISDATAMLQTAEGAFDEVTNILYRMKDLATQSANDTNTKKDRDAMQSEFDQLNGELANIVGNTSFGGEKLLAEGVGKLNNAAGLNFQIGSSKEETLNVSVNKELEALSLAMKAMKASANPVSAPAGAKGSPASTPAGAKGADLISTQTGANSAISLIETTLDSVGTIRSKLGANINRLAHTAANLTNIQDNTNLALGNIRDADFAAEASTMIRNQMLTQTGLSMLKQSNQMPGMVMSLLG